MDLIQRVGISSFPLPVCLDCFRIIPQAVSVRYGLSIGATFAPLVFALMYIFGGFDAYSQRFLK
jgi:CBS domain containing-hemolysin-like protein